MADPRILICGVPEEPPEYSVLVGAGGSTSVWQRADGLLSSPNDARWFPALYRLMERGNGFLEPKTWAHLIAEYGSLTVLRWGSGEVTDG